MVAAVTVAINLFLYKTRYLKSTDSMHDFSLLLDCKWHLCSFGILQSIVWQILTDISGMIDCTETLVKKYYSTLCKIPNERRSSVLILLTVT